MKLESPEKEKTMKSTLSSRVLWGLLLIAAGVFFLLESLNILELGSAWSLVFGTAGILFLITFIGRRDDWWAAIPGFALLGIGLLIGVDALLPELGDAIGGGLFLGSLSLGFIAIAVRTGGEQWWAVIPGGILLILGLLLGVEPYIGDDAFAGTFLLGIAATFAMVYILPLPAGNTSWALIPAGILAVIGTIVLASATAWANLIWPIALIGAGLFILLRNIRQE
jgi:hypothetical protein